MDAASKKPQVVFVLGGPGSGKGTQCAKVLENCSGWSHVSAGDCLRAERNDPDSPDGEVIRKIIDAGNIVPVEITVNLLNKAMLADVEKGVLKFLVDGFPRNEDNVRGWEKVIGNSMDVRGVLFFDLSEEDMERRLLSRAESSGRSDDNIEIIRKRFITNVEATMPIVQMYKEKGVVVTVDGSPAADEVFAEVAKAIHAWEE
eukprot:GEMP01034300.1.p1 GENE.GEMP01034300.1~~GEMP01034300.1.p1  ORF type:complete len:202 (+),score=49.08 GEMP01034300.1:163-768(+)